MQSFSLRLSPFYLLGVSLRDNRETIAEAVERKLEDGAADEAAIMRAQQVLMAPRLRLAAELAWLPVIAPSRAFELVDAAAISEQAASDLPLLAAANLAADRCCSDPRPFVRDMILRFHAERKDADIVSLINAERGVSGFPMVGEELLSEAVSQLVQLHIAALMQSVTGHRDPASEMLDILTEWFPNSPSTLVAFLDEFADRYDVWSVPVLQGAETTIESSLREIREKPVCRPEHIAALSTAAASWSSVRAPRQFLDVQRHITDARATDVFRKIRECGLYLNNERHEPAAALTLSRAITTAFEPYPELFSLLQSDMVTLQERVEENAAIKVLEPLHQAITKFNENHAKLCVSLRHGDFADGRRGPAGELFKLFKAAAHELADTSNATTPFTMVLSLAIDLHNQSHASKEALIIVRGLRGFHEVRQDPEMMERLATNGNTMREVMLQSDLKAAVDSRRFGSAVKLARELASTSANAEERTGWQKVANQLAGRRNAYYLKWGGGLAFVGVMIIVALTDENKNKPTNTYQPSPTYTTAPRSAPSTPVARTDTPVAITMPPIASGHVLSAGELTWCLFEQARLKRLRGLIESNRSNYIVSAFNERIGGVNARCMDAKFYKSDETVAQRRVEAEAAELDSEAQSIFAEWTRADPEQSSPSFTPPSYRLLSSTSQEDVKSIQRRLVELHYYRGHVNGVWNDTLPALRKFKAASGLPANSQWDLPTQTKLFGVN